MQSNDPNRKASSALKQLQLPEQSSIRNALRVVGPAILVIGLVCTIGGGISFFSSFGGFEPPHYFWLAFIGLPLMFFGFVLSQAGFMGAAARYVAGESAPVAADTANYVAEETKGAVEAVAKAAAKGVVEGIEAGRTNSESGFCAHCGSTVKSDFSFCPKCGKSLKL